MLDDVKARGFHPEGVAWRKLDTSFIAGARNSTSHRYAMVCLPLDKLGIVLYEHIQRYQHTATVHWSHRVVKVGQDEHQAWVDVQTPDGTIQRKGADYVVGCDGASSTVRRELFGSEYPGETLDAQIIATNVSSHTPLYIPFLMDG